MCKVTVYVGVTVVSFPTVFEVVYNFFAPYHALSLPPTPLSLP